MARPSFKPTPTLRRRVSIAAGGGMTHEDIAMGLGITRPTLEKHFAHELSVGAYQRRIEVLNSMFRSAKKGNVTAQKAYAALTPQMSVPPEPKEAQPDQPQGKKEQAAADAVTAQRGTEWETLLKPGAPLQ